MKVQKLLMVCLPLISAATLSAQGERFNVYGDYSYIQFNTTISGLQSRAFNGGGGGVQLNFAKILGIRADFQGYGSTQWTLTEAAPVVTPHGTIHAGTFKSNGNMFTYGFGPVVRLPLGRLVVNGEILFGQANTNGYGSLTSQIVNGGGTVNISGTQHPFMMLVGGGVDVGINHHIALRLADLDYVLTRFTNPLTSTNNQNSFRYVGGIIFKLGEH